VQLDDLQHVEVVVAELHDHELRAVSGEEGRFLGEEEELQRVDRVFEGVEGQRGEDWELAVDDRVDRDEGPQLVLSFEASLSSDGRDLALLVQGETPESDAVVDDLSAESTERVLVNPDAQQLVCAHVVAVDDFVLAVLAENVDEFLENNQNVVGDQLGAWMTRGYSWIR
jgi:hypothetical protein